MSNIIRIKMAVSQIWWILHIMKFVFFSGAMYTLSLWEIWNFIFVSVKLWAFKEKQ